MSESVHRKLYSQYIGKEGFTRSQLNVAADQLLTKPQSEDDVKVGKLFATFLQGGKDGQGYFSQVAGSKGNKERLDIDDLNWLADRKDGHHKIDERDFKDIAGKRYDPNGHPIDVARLRRGAQEEFPGYGQPPRPDFAFGDGGGFLQPQNPFYGGGFQQAGSFGGFNNGFANGGFSSFDRFSDTGLRGGCKPGFNGGFGGGYNGGGLNGLDLRQMMGQLQQMLQLLSQYGLNFGRTFA